MNKFINKILKEATKSDDPFFQPKDIQKKDEKVRQQEKEILFKIKLGLKNIKNNYENKNWETKEEKLFLQIFSKLHLNETYKKRWWRGYFLEDENNKRIGFFNLEYNEFWVSRPYILKIFMKKFRLTYNKFQSLIGNMLKKYFELYDFIPDVEVMD